MTLAEVRDWLRTVVDSPFWYIGTRDSNKTQCIALYNTTGAPTRLAVGGVSNTGYAIKPVSILIRWGKNANVAEQKAHEVYNVLFGQTAEINGKRVIMFHMPQPEPISVGSDSEGVYEYVIETHIYHER